ncbi:serine/threonine-protein phosphatase 6 regulatory ankyrin repeat subunit A isoform X2 [Patella vulgata]|uniref:serine/threonine-protein phosphatase 6 regulatory ankyrin repeat subunit A isoform X2 n=1 Tax=Patella vulgata TaxID=6465 RepID=UPI0024A94872|nr:serine/threonine-protein phosphatase 6 regulatory ankyrin repeat subunit A isoform X2 [Patella vulgata]
MASCKDSSKRTTDERIKGLDTQSPDFYQPQNVLLPEKEEPSSSHLPQRLSTRQAMVHMSTLKGDDEQSGNKNSLHEACRHGSVANVRHLIDQGTDVNSNDVYGRTCILLCSTSYIEPIDKINFLRSNGGNIHDTDDENNGILHLACDLGMLGTVQYLVDIGLDINSKGFRNRSCIMACSQSKTQAADKMELLRKMGANIYDTDVQNDCVLHLACLSGTLDTVKYLIDLGLDINTKGFKDRTCILQCILSKIQTIEKIELIKSKGGNVYDTDDNNNGMLHLAYALGSLDTVKYLIDLGLYKTTRGFKGRTHILQCSLSKIQAIEKIEFLMSKCGGNIYDEDDQNDGILHLACAFSTIDTVKYLVDLGLYITTTGFKDRTCILQCSLSKTQAIEKIEFLMSKGGNIYDRDGQNDGLLHLACAFSTLNTVKYLVDLGLYIKTRGFKGRTCILQCSLSKTQAVEKIELLMSKGGNIYGRDDQNDGILHLACAFSTLDTVKYLVDLGLDINAKGLKGRTCILQCSLSKIQAKEKIEFLMSKGGNINDRDDNNSSILHLACENGTFDTVQYLVNLGCDINFKDDAGNTPVSLGFRSDTQSIQKVDFLISKGGKLPWLMYSIYILMT